MMRSCLWNNWSTKLFIFVFLVVEVKGEPILPEMEQDMQRFCNAVLPFTSDDMDAGAMTHPQEDEIPLFPLHYSQAFEK